MDYSQYDTDQFVWDEAFVAWVKNGEHEAFWRAFEKQHPHRKAAMEQARAIIRAATHLPAQLPGEEMKRQMWEHIRQQVQPPEAAPVTAPVRSATRWWWAAAAVLLCGSLGWWLVSRNAGAADPAYRQLLHQAGLEGRKRIEAVNDHSKPLWVSLPDGSSVVLQPKAKLSYATDFGANGYRKVYLSGAAFFEVHQQAQSPFVVYVNDMIIKVLGTSFSVKTDTRDSLVYIKVKTGKVAISVNNNSRRKQELILTNNQHAVLKQGVLSVTSITLRPEVLAETPAAAASFVFHDVPVAHVFDTLEQAYGVRILYDRAKLADCRLTASLYDEPLHEKMRLICKALEASCIIDEHNITINAKGCK